MNYEQYEPVIGLEIHLQLATQSKAFCSDDASFGGEPNTHVSAISLGHPGTLPRLNKRQVEYAVRLGLALGSIISLRNAFDRKNYFYTDLPKGYQITQDRLPICVGGSMELQMDGYRRTVRIHHLHMEEDAGKSIHDLSPRHSMIDLNRAGVPLLEIVSEPDLRSGEEVDAFMTAMRQLARYLGISDGNMQEGSMRCDVNVSVRKKGETLLGERCEIKNVNSMRFARQAIEFEVKRQVDLLESGVEIVRSTLNFNPATGETSPMRDKESAHDYRYFPDPDLPPVVFTQQWVDEVADTLPELPQVLFKRFVNEFDLSENDARLLTNERETAIFFEKTVKVCASQGIAGKSAANLFINKISPWLAETGSGIEGFPVSAEQLSAFLQLIEDGKVSASIAYQRLFPELVANPTTPPLELAKSMNLIQSSDADFLEKIVDEVLAANPDKVAEYRKGKKGLIGFFMGEVMRASKGKAEPKATNELVARKLAG
ncbi:MAG: Asp-tRNA(Asn)/Glu-tRNA(Gln) amidotransferase subunit GatB [Saprospiraceae bacterium]|nr:Asp-tRNA(Asn)/Glu-tRNA(Gln) amidotransferase subunit GatB [Saprospiraceae bacterium]MCF8251980.1 Asp-tRNA(Asn)/Glu-tRNA(Gln) amidotransferase subunit GatB [Saprospiraceae bacterium]MCF8281685.1 Asp-tRNA(Asn)/Glu-tRNA(Gln) amidotransferase subunit GatB [Bacteroidales bacterium]MCF8313673.1 Asp-tRNA(Asn)/Glu-tRNA(Gln) amidotransferase subunit GatB [Saprospiraceae bacterium]MCF8442380.1 Asp-tRNA(Asn)/Glu-tRNA(Gln) amidotransferase subunit GatB [Saprospiraceae bacterium]